MDQDQEQRYLDLLRRKAAEIEAAEGPVAREAPMAARRASGDPQAPGLEAAGAETEAAQLEAIVHWHRPVLWVRNDEPERGFTFTNPDGNGTSADLLQILEARRAVLSSAMPSIGRIEVMNNAHYQWVGSGWVIDSDVGDDIVITNAHVAREFAQRSGAGFVFQRGTVDFNRPQTARVDFREEMAGGQPREFAVTDVIWISDDEILDMGVLRVARRAGSDRLSGPIRLAPEAAVAGRNVAVIGYPGDDSRSYDAEKFERLFGRVFGKKRLAPGRLTQPHAWGLRHDCSTLPGNSGSVVLDIETGRALGLHYSGTIFRTNYAVPAAAIARILRERPWQPGEAVRPVRPPLGDAPAAGGGDPSPIASIVHAGGLDGGAATGADGTVRITVPLEITVKLGAPSGGAASAPQPTAKTDQATAAAAAALVESHLRDRPDVMTVRADYLFRDGMLSDDFGVVVRVAPGASTDPAAYGLGARIGGAEVAVEIADPETIVADRIGPIREAFGGRRAEYRRDLNDPKFDLSPVTDDMKILLHVSPEAGWPVLHDFLAKRSDQLTVGMYHMTAPHVVNAIKEIAARNGSRITLTLDRQRGDASPPDDTDSPTKADDIPESVTLEELSELSGDRFRWAEASLGGDGLFASAYHIKVAVWSDRARNGKLTDKAFWLSSGNWQSSNQAPLDVRADQIDQVAWRDVADYNREWHAVVEHPGLAATFRHHLEQDYKDNAAAARTEALLPELPDILVPEELLERPRRPAQFRAFPPELIEGRVTVQPLLTPDNYPEVISRLIAGAQERILIENQSFDLWTDPNETPPHFLSIVEAVRDKQRQGLDVRIIFRSGFGKEREKLRRLKKLRIKTDPDHVRFFDTCHTKGIVVDRNVAVLGSHNWTAGGTGPNRDASLLIRHRKANSYFASLFEYDWDQVARNQVRPERAVRESVRIIPAGAEAPAPSGYRRISLGEFLGET